MSAATYFIETYGCQMNEHDSEKMAAILETMGMSPVPTPDLADVVVINTCSIREKAESKVYSALGRLRSLKAKHPAMVTVVAGCVAQQESERLLKRVPHLDVVLGTHAIARLPDVIRAVQKRRERVVQTDFVDDVASLHLPAPGKGVSRVCSYVTIMQGCSNFCSYCVVPFTRGPEQSRPTQEIIGEVECLVQRGVQEVTLLGQNVNAYGKDRGEANGFVKLLERLNAIKGLRRVRFTTSHPRDFDASLAHAIAELPAVCEHIHLPLQSGSDWVLAAMNRGYTLQEYEEKISLLRELTPVAITADMIVGFPGETDEHFQETLRALERIKFDQIFSFKYSPRPNTAAAGFPDQVPERVKAERLAQVHAVQDAITLAYHRAAEGTVAEVLVEGIKGDTGQPFGRTRGNKIVNLVTADGIHEGDCLPVRIVRGLKHSLLGAPISEEPSGSSHHRAGNEM